MVLMGGGAAFKWLAQLCRRVHAGVAPVLQWSQGLLDGEGGTSIAEGRMGFQPCHSVPAGVKKRGEGRGGSCWHRIGKCYISVCAALAVTGGTTTKSCQVYPHPPEASST